MHIPARGLTIAAALTAASVLTFALASYVPEAGFAARAQESAKDKMTTAGKTAQQVKELLRKLPDDPPAPNGKGNGKGSTTLHRGKAAPVVTGRQVGNCESDPACGGENKVKAGAAVLSKSRVPCSDPECGGENRTKTGPAAQ